jgi:hypothetical protein
MPTINYTRHYTARVHQTFEGVEVTVEMLNDPTYFDQDTQEPTPHFDDWVCSNCIPGHDHDEPVEDWDLSTEVESITAPVRDWYTDGHCVAASDEAAARAECVALYGHTPDEVRPWTTTDQAHLDA